MRPIKHDDVRTFCRVDGWQRKSDAPGRAVRKHEVWTRTLASGDVLRVVISKGGGEYSAGLASRIIKHELRVTESEFWAAVREHRPPERPAAAAPRAEQARLPLGLARALLRAGHTEAELAGLTPEEARRLLEKG